MSSGLVTRAVALVVLVVLAGCASHPPMTHVGPSLPSTACGDAFAEMSREVGEGAAADLSTPRGREIERIALERCTSAEEWIAGAIQHPGSVGVSDASAIDGSVLALRCGPERPELRDSPVCVDAIATGVVPR
ncbi:hypothetical protein [Cellulomonas sp.]|uniref:hypothetical protein n=1 Tax=Cellulomonas sp. TaxID=40001 RepID=UPI001B1E563E|nr:hypothetical protein [Cellulomonas sp.]MBO9556906.1 hypothetical protein [Cellulomonas sp.]